MINQLIFEEEVIFQIIEVEYVLILEYLFDTNPHFEVVKTSSCL